jgi:hypothetical protein
VPVRTKEGGNLKLDQLLEAMAGQLRDPLAEPTAIE